MQPVDSLSGRLGQFTTQKIFSVGGTMVGKKICRTMFSPAFGAVQ